MTLKLCVCYYSDYVAEAFIVEDEEECKEENAEFCVVEGIDGDAF